MNKNLTNTSQLFTLLEGTWRGKGRGEYPTITPFDYRETLIFTRRDERSQAYEQRMVSSARKFELEEDTLRYEMEMQTTKTSQLTSHLKTALERVN